MSAIARRRHARLRAGLPAEQAMGPVTPAWLQHRVAYYLELADIDAELILDATDYVRRTGRPHDPRRAGEVYRWPDRADRPLLFLDPYHLPSREEATRVIAHEVMHLRWPSYGHKQIAFHRAQQLLDAAAARTCGRSRKPVSGRDGRSERR